VWDDPVRILHRCLILIKLEYKIVIVSSPHSSVVKKLTIL